MSLRQTVLCTLQYVTGPWVTRLPLHRVPQWLGQLQEIKVPRGAAKNEVRACSGGANINILIALLSDVEDLDGQLAECGVYRGSTLIPTGLYLKQRAWNKVVYGFDSFEGFDASVSSEIALGGAPDSEKRRGGFGDTSLEYVDAKVRRFRLQRHVHLVKGYLSTTLAHYSALTFSFVHLDVDIYDSYKIGLEFFYPRVTSGGVILFDEYNDPPWPGCNKAVDEFLADKPETLQEIERDNHVKYFIRKL
jgi:O-methyltransferase